MNEWRGLEVEGRRVVVVGGRAALLGVVTSLSQAGAEVVVVADELVPALADLVDRGLINQQRGPLGSAHLDQTSLLILTGTPEEVDRLRRLAAEAAVLVHVVRDAESGPVSGSDRPSPRESDRPSPRESGGSDPVERPRTGTGEVILVGGGPGSPGLLTLAGLAALESADVIACDRLAPLALLERAAPHAEIVDVSKMPRGTYTPQDAINALIVDRARAGKKVVRLKGGDSFVFGRGGEEWQACAAAGVAVTVIPGVSSAIAAPAAAGVPLTHRTLTQGFAVLSGHVEPDDPRSTLDWDALGRSDLSLVVLMGLATLPAVTARLVRAGRAADTPAVAIADATLPSMRVIRDRLDGLAAACERAGLSSPVTVVIGAVAGFDPAAGSGR